VLRLISSMVRPCLAARVPMAVAMLLEPMMLTVVMMRVPPSCQGSVGCDGLAGVMGCVEGVGRAVETWHLSSRLFPAGSRMNTA
jgi:hypothetical protein